MKKSESREIMKRLNEASFQYVFKSQDVDEVIEEDMLVVSLQDAFNILSAFEEKEPAIEINVNSDPEEFGKVLKELLERKHKREQ